MQVTEPALRPTRGGFLRPFGCARFIRGFLLGRGPEGSIVIDPRVGAPQADIFYHYKTALLRATASDRAIKFEERQARKEDRAISPEEIERLTEKILARLPYKTKFARYHSFVVYFHNLIRLRWVEPTGQEEPSAFQEHYPPGPPRRYYRLTARGVRAPVSAWVNPLATLYGPRVKPPVPPSPPVPAPERRPKPAAKARPALPPPAAPPVAAPTRPPTEIPAFEVAPKPSRGAAQRLIVHLRKVEKIGLDWPEVQAELERLGGEVSGWEGLVGEAANKEEEKDEPDEDKAGALRERETALGEAASGLETGDVDAAAQALEEAFPKPGRVKQEGA